MRQSDAMHVEVAYKEPDIFEQLGNNFDVEEYTQRDNCLILTLWNGDEVTIPMCEIAYFVATE